MLMLFCMDWACCGKRKAAIGSNHMIANLNVKIYFTKSKSDENSLNIKFLSHF